MDVPLCASQFKGQQRQRQKFAANLAASFTAKDLPPLTCNIDASQSIHKREEGLRLGTCTGHTKKQAQLNSRWQSKKIQNKTHRKVKKRKRWREKRRSMEPRIVVEQNNLTHSLLNFSVDLVRSRAARKRNNRSW